VDCELLRQKTRQAIPLDQASCARFVERTDLDLRKTTRPIDDVFANALLSGVTMTKLTLPNSEGCRSIGFST
jgi:hypothetical protein